MSIDKRFRFIFEIKKFIENIISWRNINILIISPNNSYYNLE